MFQTSSPSNSCCESFPENTPAAFLQLDEKSYWGGLSQGVKKKEKKGITSQPPQLPKHENVLELSCKFCLNPTKYRRGMFRSGLRCSARDDPSFRCCLRLNFCLIPALRPASLVHQLALRFMWTCQAVIARLSIGGGNKYRTICMHVLTCIDRW